MTEFSAQPGSVDRKGRFAHLAEELASRRAIIDPGLNTKQAQKGVAKYNKLFDRNSGEEIYLTVLTESEMSLKNFNEQVEAARPTPFSAPVKKTEDDATQPLPKAKKARVAKPSIETVTARIEELNQVVAESIDLFREQSQGITSALVEKVDGLAEDLGRVFALSALTNRDVYIVNSIEESIAEANKDSKIVDRINKQLREELSAEISGLPGGPKSFLRCKYGSCSGTAYCQCKLRIFVNLEAKDEHELECGEIRRKQEDAKDESTTSE